MEIESKAVDMWSVGCIMYFLLFGVPPFYSVKEDEDENEDEIFDSVLEGTVRFPDSIIISDSAKDLILLLLEKDPAKRITIENALHHEWITSFSEFNHCLSPSETSVESENIVPTDSCMDTEEDGNSDPNHGRAISSSTFENPFNCSLKNSINRIIDVQQEKDHVDEEVAY